MKSAVPTLERTARGLPTTQKRCPPRLRRPLPGLMYDLAIAGLILLSSSVALYRLIWMGQP